MLPAALFSTALFSAGPWLSGCASPPEPKAPAPVKVEWSSAGSGEDTSGDSQIKPGEVDLDAPPPKKAVAAKKEPAPAKEPPPEPAPEPSAESTPAAVEDETESDVEAAEPAATAAAVATPLGKEMHAAVKSDEKPSATKKPPAKKHAAAATAAAAPKPASAYTGPNPCKTTHFSVPRVQEACENGGRTAAKGVMKDAIGKALAAGASLKCGDCHAEQTNYTLKKDAVAQLKKWLGP